MISIVLPTYNRGTTLARAIDSVLAQTCSDWELVVVDDGSRDGTADVLARYTDARILVVRHDRNKGVTAAKNSGFDAMSGEWFTVLDSDDELVPGALEALADTCARTGALAITCNCLDSQTGEMTGRGWEADGWKTERDLSQLSGDHWGLTHSSLLGDMRFDERLPGYEGVLWTKVTHRAGRRYFLHQALSIVHTEGDDRVSVRPAARNLAEQVRIDFVLGEDTEYLRLLADVNPREHARLRWRILQARLLASSGVLRAPGVRHLSGRKFKALVGGVGLSLCIAVVSAAAAVKVRRHAARPVRRR